MSTIKINELATKALATTDYFATADNSGVAYKSTLTALSNFINTMAGVDFRGSLAIADTPVLDGWYLASESGTYTNAGSLVVDLNNGVSIIIVSSTQTVFELIEIPLAISEPSIISGWAMVEAFSWSNIIYDSNYNLITADIVWSDGDIGDIDNVVVGTYGITSMRYNRNGGTKYATRSITYDGSGFVDTDTVTLTGF